MCMKGTYVILLLHRKKIFFFILMMWLHGKNKKKALLITTHTSWYVSRIMILQIVLGSLCIHTNLLNVRGFFYLHLMHNGPWIPVYTGWDKRDIVQIFDPGGSPVKFLWVLIAKGWKVPTAVVPSYKRDWIQSYARVYTLDAFIPAYTGTHLDWGPSGRPPASSLRVVDRCACARERARERERGLFKEFKEFFIYDVITS